MTAGNIIFLVLLVLAAGFLSFNIQRLVRYARIGRADYRLDHPVERFRNLLLVGFAQSKILRDPVAGLMHATVFWGFLVLTIGSLEVLIQGVVQGFSYDFLPGPLYALYLFSQEAFAIFVLGAVGWLLYRRLVIKPKRLQGDQIHHGDALFILSMIAGLMLTLLFTGGLEAHTGPDRAHPAQLISRVLGGTLFAFLSPEAAHVGREISWWSHALLLLVFANYLPYSKHLHVFTSLPNTFFSNTSGPGPIGTMRFIDLEAEGVEQFGASDVEHLSWKALMDGYSCTECGRCTAACPANITGKTLSPRKIVVNTRQRLMEKAPLLIAETVGWRDPRLAAGE